MDPSLNELRIQLQNELKKEGVVDNMKSQLRYKLLERLQMQQRKPLQSQSASNEGLPKRVAASLVADFLKGCGFDYCLSVFVPECGYGGNMLERDELSVLLKVESPANSVLMTLCEEILLHKPREAPRTNSATQTYTSDAVMSLEQRLNHVDTAYRTKIEGELLKPHQEIEERMLKMKRDLEQRMKAELQAEIAKIREFETQEIRLQEADKHRTKQQEYREELERNYQERLQKLRDRERDIMEKATNKTKELETLNYNYRQKIMKETELLRMKESEVQKERELNEERMKLMQAKLEAKERDLQRRLSEVENQKYELLRDQESTWTNGTRTTST